MSLNKSDAKQAMTMHMPSIKVEVKTKEEMRYDTLGDWYYVPLVVNSIEDPEGLLLI